MLYMAAACPLPELPWNSTDPRLNTRAPDPDDPADEHANHNQLARLLERLLESCEAIELYGCWNGELAERRAGQQEISADAIRASHFGFRERCKCIVNGMMDGATAFCSYLLTERNL